MSKRRGALAATLLITAARAANFVWDGGGNGNLGGAANWNPDGSPPNDGTADLVFSGSSQFTPNAQAAYTLNTLRFSNIAGLVPFTITGEKITFVQDGTTPPFIRNETSYSNAFSNIVEFQDSGNVRAQNGSLSFSNTFITGPPGGGGHLVTLTADAGRTLQFDAIAGTGDIRVEGAGTVRFRGVNINSGTVHIVGTAELDAAIAGPPSLTITGTLRLLSANRIASMPLMLGGNLSLRGFQETIGPLSGSGTISLGLNGDLRVDQNSSTSFAGTIAGEGTASSFRKEGSGVLTLGGGAVYVGTTTVAEGTLRVTTSAAQAPFADLVINSGATFDASAPVSVPTVTGRGTLQIGASGSLSAGVLNEDFTFDGTFEGPGNFFKDGTGTLRLTNPEGSFDGDYRILQGIIELVGEGVGSGGAGVRVASGATLRTPSGQMQSFGGGGISLAGSGVGNQGALRVINDAPGDTTIFGEVTLTGDTKIFSESDALLWLSSNVHVGTHDLTVAGSGGADFVAALSGNGSLSLNAAHTSRLRSDNSGFTGEILVNDGVLEIRNGLALGSGTRPVEVAEGASLVLWGNPNVSSARPLRIEGELVTNATSSWSGSGNVSIGSNGRLTVGGTGFTWDGSGMISADGALLADVEAGSTFNMRRNLVSASVGLIKVGLGDMQLNGTLTDTFGVIVSLGKLTLGSSNRIGDTSYLSLGAVAILDLNDFSDKTGGLLGLGNLRLGRGTLTLSPDSTAATYTFGGNISGTGAVVIESSIAGGRQIFSSANGYTGPTTVRTGSVLEVTAAGGLSPTGRLTVEGTGRVLLAPAGQRVGSISGSGRIVHTSGAAVLETGTEKTPVTWAGVIEGPGGLTLSGARSDGQVIMTQGQTLTGPTRVTVGRLTSAGLFASAVTIGGSGSLWATGKHSDIDCSGVLRNRNPGEGIGAKQLTMRTGSLLEKTFDTWDAEAVIGADSVNWNGGNILLTGDSLPPLGPGEVKVVKVVDSLSFTGKPSGIGVELAGDLAGFGGTATVRRAGTSLEVVLTAPGDTDYWTWISQFDVGAFDHPELDPDGDGVTNGIEFVVGGDPAEADDSALLPVLVDDGTHVEFTFRRRTRAASLSVAEHLTDLSASWIPAVHGSGGVTITTAPVDGTLDLVTVRIPKSGAPRRFVRLRADIFIPA